MLSNSDGMGHLILTGINPEPWAMGTALASRRGGQSRGGDAPNQRLVTYQQAVRDEYKRIGPGMVFKPEDLISLQFFFWRQVDTWTSGGKTHTGNYADATNLQKS